MADPEFGSGAVKITPAHDPNDFAAGKRHNLPSIKVIDENAKMTAEAGRFAGLDRFEARKQVVAELEKLGLLEKIEPHKLSIAKCHRCRTIVEPLVSTQWWVKIKPLADPAIAAVEDGRIEFVPANWSKTYLTCFPGRAQVWRHPRFFKITVKKFLTAQVVLNLISGVKGRSACCW